MWLLKNIHRENIQAWLGAFELWFTKASRIALVMARGAYWLGERKRLMTLLGDHAYEQIRSNAPNLAALESLAKQLDRINGKIEAEETLIQSIRLGEPPIEGGASK